MLEIKMIDRKGNVLEDPRWVLAAWGGRWVGGCWAWAGLG